MESPERDPLRDARTHRRSLATAFRFWAGRSNLDVLALDQGIAREYEADDHVLNRAWLAEGEGAGAELRVDGRPQPWSLDLARVASRLSACEGAGCLLWDETDRKYLPRTLGCGLRLCPVCERGRAARAAARWRAVLECAAGDGAELHHITLTQRASAEPGGLVTGPELRRGWRGTLAADGVVARPTAGESLGAAYERLRGTLREARQGRATRKLWAGALGGYILGTEWTGRGPGGIPRWHVHAHILTCNPRGEGLPPDLIVRDWCKRTGASARAQHVRQCEPDSVIEVIKYPFKPAHLTSAQRIETLAYARGMHPHQVGGGWHGRSRASRSPPWSRWLAARPPDRTFRRLHYLPDDAPEPRLYTGQVTEGEITWAVRRPTAPDGWARFTGRAEWAAELLGKRPGSEWPEPGSDLDEWVDAGA